MQSGGRQLEPGMWKSKLIFKLLGLSWVEQSFNLRRNLSCSGTVVYFRVQPLAVREFVSIT